jgi:hypothetical protein
MHANNIVHGDIKPLNVVRLDEQWKLIDLDASCQIGSGAKAAAKYSSAYLPPEMIVKNRDGELCVRSEMSQGLDSSELREPTVALDCKTYMCVCVCVCVLQLYDSRLSS